MLKYATMNVFIALCLLLAVLLILSVEHEMVSHYGVNLHAIETINFAVLVTHSDIFTCMCMLLCLFKISFS